MHGLALDSLRLEPRARLPRRRRRGLVLGGGPGAEHRPAHHRAAGRRARRGARRRAFRAGRQRDQAHLGRSGSDGAPAGDGRRRHARVADRGGQVALHRGHGVHHGQRADRSTRPAPDHRGHAPRASRDRDRDRRLEHRARSAPAGGRHRHPQLHPDPARCRGEEDRRPRRPALRHPGVPEEARQPDHGRGPVPRRVLRLRPERHDDQGPARAGPGARPEELPGHHRESSGAVGAGQARRRDLHRDGRSRRCRAPGPPRAAEASATPRAGVARDASRAAHQPAHPGRLRLAGRGAGCLENRDATQGERR